MVQRRAFGISDLNHDFILFVMENSELTFKAFR